MGAKELPPGGLLTSIDVSARGLYCEAFARWKHANAQILRFGTVIKSRTGYPVQSPYLAIANKAHEQMTHLLVEIGMTPARPPRSRSHGSGGPGSVQLPAQLRNWSSGRPAAGARITCRPLPTTRRTWQKPISASNKCAPRFQNCQSAS